MLTERLVQVGDLAGRVVLDVGCGTGLIAAELAERHGSTVVGVDPSPEMLEVARGRSGARARFEPGRAEELAFADETFERAVMVSVVHHVDRPQAFAQVRRVLEPGGRFVISNADPDGFSEMWVMRWFPELIPRELARFPRADELAHELGAAGFEAVQIEGASVERRLTRDQALAKIRGKHLSSFDLLSEDEYRAGLERAERELSDPVDYTLRSLFAAAVRPGR